MKDVSFAPHFGHLKNHVVYSPLFSYFLRSLVFTDYRSISLPLARKKNPTNSPSWTCWDKPKEKTSIVASRAKCCHQNKVQQLLLRWSLKELSTCKRRKRGQKYPRAAMRQQAASQNTVLYLNRAQWRGSSCIRPARSVNNWFSCFADEKVGTKLFKAIQLLSGRTRTVFLAAWELYE